MWAHFLPLAVYSFFSKFHQNSIKFECIFGVFAQWKTRFFLSKKVLKNCIFHWFWALFRNFCKTEKFSQVQNFLRIFTVAPCKYTGDHRQIMGIMGRLWAISRVFLKLCPNCTKSLYNHQRRSRPWNTTKTQDLNLIFFNKSVILHKSVPPDWKSLINWTENHS